MSFALTSSIAIVLAILFSVVGGRLRRRERERNAAGEAKANRAALDTIARIEAERQARNRRR